MRERGEEKGGKWSGPGRLFGFVDGPRDPIAAGRKGVFVLPANRSFETGDTALQFSAIILGRIERGPAVSGNMS